METFAAALYQEELPRFQSDRKSQGGRKIKGELAPHEEACLSVQKQLKYFANMTPRAFANLMSSRKSR
jgi:hypothetical protein